MYRNGVYTNTRTGTTTASPFQFSEYVNENEIITFKIRSYAAITIGINLLIKELKLLHLQLFLLLQERQFQRQQQLRLLI